MASRKLRLRYRTLIEKDEDGKFTVTVPELPGCISFGSSRAEALDNIKEAIQAYIESLQKHNEPIPPPISEEIGLVHSNTRLTPPILSKSLSFE